MPRRKSRKPTDEHTYIAVRVDGHQARASASVNPYAYEPQQAWRDTDDEPLYNFVTHLDITGTSIYPADRAGQVYELTIYGEDAPSSDVYAKLKDVHVQDEHHVPRYRTYRGTQVPVYAAPKGMGMIDRVRGESRWTGAIFVRPRFVSDLLLLLGRQGPLFIEIHERKHERRRWLQSVSLQTTNPAEE